MSATRYEIELPSREEGQFCRLYLNVTRFEILTVDSDNDLRDQK